MRLFGLIGYPLSHSFSKKYFAGKFEKEGFSDCRYENFPIETIHEIPKLLKEHPNLEGLNVTIPYKEQVLAFLHSKNTIVEAINASNCISIRNGHLRGHNTDVAGFEQSLEPLLRPHHNKAFILGTGGASKAVEYVLHKKNITCHYVSRKPQPGYFTYEQLTPELMADHTLIINTTPLGMYPSVNDGPPIPYETLTASHYLFDLVYNPSKTLFLQKGEGRGAAIKNGQDMLIIQAEESWKIWNESGNSY
jgi:shikimate dehydrogenase